jgi:hypothetical protein
MRNQTTQSAFKTPYNFGIRQDTEKEQSKTRAIEKNRPPKSKPAVIFHTFAPYPKKRDSAYDFHETYHKHHCINN